MVTPLPPSNDKDPLVDLGGSGPSTLQPGIYTGMRPGEIEFVGQMPNLLGVDLTAGVAPQTTARSGLSRGLREGQYVFNGQVPDYTDVPLTPEAAQQDAISRLGAAQSADRAMLNSARAAGSGAPAGTEDEVADPTANADLGALLAAIASDSQSMFDQLQRQAGARGQATADAVGQLTGQVTGNIEGVAGRVGSDAGGGLSGGQLSQGASAGSSGVRDVQAALGGFLQQSQMRRTNAVQNYLTGLQGQSQIAQDRARTLGEFMQSQQQALMEQEEQDDIAAATASNAILRSIGLPSIPGLSPDQALRYADTVRKFGGEEAGQEVVGPIEQTFRDAGINPTVVPGLSQIELQGQQLMQSLPEDQWPTPEQFIRERTVVVPDGSPLVGRTLQPGDEIPDSGGMRVPEAAGSRLVIGESDLNRYLQAEKVGLLNFGGE